MTARVGYLVALASGRRDGPPLQPPRPYYPPVSLADTELAFGQDLADPEPGPLPPGTPAGLPAPTGTAPAAPAAPAASAASAAKQPGPGGPVGAASRRSKANGVIDLGRAGPPGRAEGTGRPRQAEGTGQRPRQAEATSRMAASGLPVTGPDGPHVRSEADVTAGLPRHPGPVAGPAVSGIRPGGPPASGFAVSAAGAPTPVPPAAEGMPHPPRPRDQPVAAEGISTGAALSSAGNQSAVPADPPRRRPILNAAAGQPAGSEAPAAEAGVRGYQRYPQEQDAAVEHDRVITDAEDEAVARLEWQTGPGAAAGRQSRGAARDQAAVPQLAGDVAEVPLRRRQGDSRRQGDMGAAEAPAALSIGTVEITVLPPLPEDPANPGTSRPAPANPPDRLSRGVGPWFGWDQS